MKSTLRIKPLAAPTEWSFHERVADIIRTLRRLFSPHVSPDATNGRRRQSVN